MISADPAIAALLEASPQDGHGERKLVYVTVRDRATGEPVGRGLWDGAEDLTFTVVSGLTGLPEDRDYYSAALISVGEIACTNDLNVQSVDIDMSQIADVAQQLMRQYNARLARVEIHTLYLHPVTGNRVGSLLDWVGEVDRAPVKTPKIGGKGSIAIRAVSDIISMLTRVSGRKSSHEDQMLHGDGDQINKYASTAGSWKIPWGQKTL